MNSVANGCWCGFLLEQLICLDVIAAFIIEFGNLRVIGVASYWLPLGSPSLIVVNCKSQVE